MVKVSVIIPAYNCAKTLRDTVESVLKSGLSNLQILIIDDGSVDGTSRVCDILEKEHSCVRSIHQKNAGVSAARNRGLREATGDYIWFVDADDSIKEGSLLSAEEILQIQSPDMLVFGMEFDYYHRGMIFRRDKMMPPMEGVVELPECRKRLYELFTSNSLSSLCNRIIKRSKLEQMNAYLQEDMILYEDLEFSLRVQMECSNVYFYQEAAYQYRQSEDEGNASRRLKKISHIPDLLSKIEAALADEADKDRILLRLFLTLAREKINISSPKEIKTICSDFHEWIDTHDLLHTITQRSYPMMIYQGQTAKLVVKRTYSKLRHKTANLIKQQIGDFRKWSFPF